MKNKIGMSEILCAHAEIDLCYLGLQMLYEEVSKEIAPIDKMIDNATGYSKEKNKENRENAIILLSRIIKAKKIIEVDYSGDENVLAEIKAITKTHFN